MSANDTVIQEQSMSPSSQSEKVKATKTKTLPMLHRRRRWEQIDVLVRPPHSEKGQTIRCNVRYSNEKTRDYEVMSHLINTMLLL